MAEQKATQVAVAERRPARLVDQLEREMTDMRRRMERFFPWPFAPVTGPPTESTTVWAPTTDAYEADGKFVVKAELPGVTQEDIKVQLEEGVLTVEARRHEEKERQEAHYHTCERFIGTLQRSFSLPEGVQTDKITARFKDGMLEVQVPLPKQAPAKAQGVNIPITG